MVLGSFRSDTAGCVKSLDVIGVGITDHASAVDEGRLVCNIHGGSFVHETGVNDKDDRGRV